MELVTIYLQERNGFMDKEEFDKQLNAFSERVLSKALSSEEEANYTESLFESIRHVNKYDQEFWYARELQLALEYKEWRNFIKVINKAKMACEGSEVAVSDHFVDVNKMVSAGVASKEIDDIELSRYACYLIVQNGDPRKKVIALGQSYFAVKTRQQEIIDNYDNLDEDQKRLAIRKEMKEHNKLLVAAAKDAGVQTGLDYAIFQNCGYKGLYGGMTAKDIKVHKQLGKNDDILDYMGHEELAANLFRATQTEAKLRRDHIIGKENANQTHYAVGKEVRNTIARLGGTMPENLSTPEKSIKQLEREQKALQNKAGKS